MLKSGEALVADVQNMSLQQRDSEAPRPKVSWGSLLIHNCGLATPSFILRCNQVT